MYGAHGNVVVWFQVIYGLFPMATLHIHRQRLRKEKSALVKRSFQFVVMTH